jgi:NADH-quinone oxidoreductase subunit A
MPDQPLPYYVNYLPLLMQIVIACLVAGGMVALSALLGKHRYSRTKMAA